MTDFLDGIVLAILLVSALMAFFRGFIAEVTAVGSWVVSVIGAFLAFPHVQPIARQHIQEIWMADLAAAIAPFILVMILMTLISSWIKSMLNALNHGPLDRALGFLFGAVRGAVILSLIWLGFVMIFGHEDHPEWIEKSRTRPFLAQGAHWIASIVPRDYRPEMPDQFDSIGESVRQLMEGQEALRNIEQNIGEKIDDIRDNGLKNDDKSPKSSGGTASGNAGGKKGDGYSDTDRKSLNDLFKQSQ